MFKLWQYLVKNYPYMVFLKITGFYTLNDVVVVLCEHGYAKNKEEIFMSRLEFNEITGKKVNSTIFGIKHSVN